MSGRAKRQCKRRRQRKLVGADFALYFFSWPSVTARRPRSREPLSRSSNARLLPAMREDRPILRA